MQQVTPWQGTTDGLPWMHRALVRLLGVVPVGVVYAVAALFFVPFYLLVRRQCYRVQYRFFRQRLGFGPFRSMRYAVLNHYRFAQVIIDRFAVYGGRTFRFEVEGREQYDALACGDEGFVQVFSHAGNYELAGYELRQPRKRLYALLFPDGSQAVMSGRSAAFAPNGVEMVFSQPDMSHIFLLSNAVRDGHIASIPGDRIFGSRKFVECSFLGAPARFPLGPFRLAAARQVPLVAIFVMKESLTSYRILVHRLDVAPALGARPSALGLAQQFAARLEQVVRRYPEQWFNYYDFWNE